MNILAIDTSCDETSAAVTSGRRILSNVLYSQIDIHKAWGGVVPNLAKRAHEERIDGVVQSALDEAGTTMKDIDAIAVTRGPGLAIALGVGIQKAKELAQEHGKKLIAMNHMEGHIYSCFAQDADGKPDIPFEFPYLVLLVSGVHTEIVLFTDHLTYKILGATRDDAVGEAIDKGARMLLGADVYPGGPELERLAENGNPSFVKFPRPMQQSDNLDFSYSGLKTALLYELKKYSPMELEEHKADLAASYQEALFDSILVKLEKAMKQHNVQSVCVGGGVIANKYLRSKIEGLVHANNGIVLFPQFKNLYGDNAAMIGVAAHYHVEAGNFVEDIESLERYARFSLDEVRPQSR